jgi:hypothetical protein
MQKKNNRLLALAGLAIIVLIALSPFFVADVTGWSNGGYSANPASPDYGTHDWIAEHALDWLPQQEKQFLLDNKTAYLYGTELPDNNQASDGVGDTTKHHVYYRADGSLQDDAAAVRAREEYAKAVSAYNSGNRAEAAKRLGVVSHYVADIAVFGHVMGASTAWGAEQHHSDYEDYVNIRTNIYQDEFNGFLVFDGTLSKTLPYDAARTLAYDTTFDVDGDLTCVWMDTHYDWSDQAFRNRAGESLNLAVNAVADVLHTFYSETVIPEFPSSLTLAVLLFLALPVALFANKKGLHKKA